MSVDAGKFRHEALLYSGAANFVARCVPFIRGGLEAGEPVLVVESGERIAMLRDALGADALGVEFADMADVGANPARIIPAWRDFVDRGHAAGKRLRGIGEPIWRGRTRDELSECQRHESLLNVAFGGGRGWWLLCPYDVEQLEPSIIEEARRSHEYVLEAEGTADRSDRYRGIEASGAPFNTPLPEPAGLRRIISFDADGLFAMRGEVTRQSLAAGMAADRATQFVSAVNEVATNSVLHGGGMGTLRIWRDAGALVCEIRDAGAYSGPLSDRTRPGSSSTESRGLWMANQLCDLVQIRTLPDGTVVRLHMKLPS